MKMTVEVCFEAPRRNLIQTFRALQAVAEVGFVVVVPDHEAPRWEYASAWFPFKFRIGSDAPVLPISIDHQAPTVTIGQLTRPLLFPHRALDLYKAAWSDRTIKASFTGNESPKRRAWLRDWEKTNSVTPGGAWRLGDDAISIRFVKSGRSWPTKAWDAEYVEELGASQFVLCPDGDFVWTYRFFEAIGAGAIPIVENMAPLYEGFDFATIDLFEEQRWSSERADANFERARQMLTAPIAEISQAVHSVIGA